MSHRKLNYPRPDIAVLPRASTACAARDRCGHGVAYGGGMGIALACDIRIGTPATRFCTQFIKLGLGGCHIGVSYTLP